MSETRCAPLHALPSPLLTGLLLALLAALLAGGCAPAHPGMGRAITYTHPVPPGMTFDLARAAPLDDAELAAQLARTRLVLLGEHHVEPRSHAFQAAMVERLARTGRPLVVALEMFPPAADPALEEWRQGQLDELTFLERSDWYRHWGFPWAYYRELFLRLRDLSVPLRGVNVSRAEREAVRSGHPEELPPDVRELLGDLDAPVPAHDAYLLHTLAQVGHLPDLEAESDTFQRYARVQRAWDRAMGTRLARLAERQPDDGVAVLLVGSGHLAFGLGANLRAARTTTLPQLTVWDALVDEAELDAEGRYPVPVGIADWARVYVRPTGPDAPQGYPSLAPVRLESAPNGVRVVAVHAPQASPLRQLQPDDLILALEGATPRSPTALRLAYERLPLERPARFAILRGQQRLELTLTPTPAAF